MSVKKQPTLRFGLPGPPVNINKKQFDVSYKTLLSMPLACADMKYKCESRTEISFSFFLTNIVHVDPRQTGDRV